MAKNLKLSDTAVNAEVDALTALLANGYLRIYDGTQPATSGAAITTQTLLAELRFGSPAYGAAAAGVATANAITSDASAPASGTAAWFRALKADGTTAIFDGSVDTADADLVLNSVAISSGAQVDCTSLTYTAPKE